MPTFVAQDVKDKAKAFIKRKIEQLSQEHAAALASCEQQKTLLVSARNIAERERDELIVQRDQMREELRAAAASNHPASAPMPTLATCELSKTLTERNCQLERESRELLQVTSTTPMSSSGAVQCASFGVWSLFHFDSGTSRKRCDGDAGCR